MIRIFFIDKRSVFTWLMVGAGVICSAAVNAQNEGVAASDRHLSPGKGNFTFYWGWNRALYSVSDIHFSGPNYDFVLHNVPAHDRQSEVAIDPYLKIKSITIPQVNYRIGYFVSNRLEVSFGVDHMKYVMYNDVEVEIGGYIADSGTPYDGVYLDQRITLDRKFLLFEHTDGLNYVNAAANFHTALTNLLNKSPMRLRLDGFLGGSAGLMYPKTNTTLLDAERYDEFHLSGYGLAFQSGVRILLRNRFFGHLEGKLGYIRMPDVRTTNNESDKAEHSFYFSQFNFGIGVMINSAKRTRQ